MIVNQEQSNQFNLQNNQKLISYLRLHNIDFNKQNISTIINDLLEQKDQIIQSMQGCITKYKAEQLKNNKLINQLQGKIEQICPNNNNTGSSFMMASQFKQYFQDFIKNCLPSTFSALLPQPQAYCKYITLVFSTVYNKMNKLLQQKLNEISKLLNLSQNTQNRNKIKNSLLKIMQNNWQTLLMNQIKGQNQSESKELWLKQIKDKLRFQNQQVVQILQAQQFGQFIQNLSKICGYMLLQQKKWQFVLPFEIQSDRMQQQILFKVIKYCKKDHVCIDGWIKEKQDALVILEGLSKQTDDGTTLRHPNLKNYVIPFKINQQHKFIFKKENIQQQIKRINNKQQQRRAPQKLDIGCQYSPKQKTIKKILQPSNIQNIISPNRSATNIKIKTQHNYSSQIKEKSKIELKDKQKEKQREKIQIKQKEKQLKQKTDTYQQRFRDKVDKIQTAIRKLNKFEQKKHDNYLQLQGVLSPKLQINKKQKQNSQNNHTLKLHNLQNIQDPDANSSQIPKACGKHTKNSNRNIHNLISDPSFEQIMSIPKQRDIIDQLPLKREHSKNKKSSSRKTSVGKIVGQHVDAKENGSGKGNKENRQLVNRDRDCATQQGKEVMYKEMIRQKLGENKTDRERPKESKNKYKDEDRPLRIMHFKKIRDKYLNA